MKKPPDRSRKHLLRFKFTLAAAPFLLILGWLSWDAYYGYGSAAPEGLVLVSAIISLAHALKLKVVAAGVETEEQSRLRRLLDCDEMQGFLFSKPVPSEIFEARYWSRLRPGDSTNPGRPACKINELVNSSAAAWHSRPGRISWTDPGIFG